MGCIVICSHVCRLLWLVSLCSSEDVGVNTLVKFWLQSHTPSTEPPPSFESWISDYYYPTLEWVLSAENQVVDTTVTGLVMNGLTHVLQAQSKTQIVCRLIQGLGGNLTEVKKLSWPRWCWTWHTRRHLTQGGHWTHVTMRRQVVWPPTSLK